MKKQLTTILLLMTLISYSQSKFMHSVGLTKFTYSIRGLSEEFSYNDNELSAIGVTYSPRFNVINFNENNTISLGTTITIGASNNKNGASIMGDISLGAAYNFGTAASRVSNTKFGGFVGAGIVSHYGNIFYKTNGLQLNGGLRFLIKNKPLEIRASYVGEKRNFGIYHPVDTIIEEGAIHIFGIGLHYTFGM